MQMADPSRAAQVPSLTELELTDSHLRERGVSRELLLNGRMLRVVRDAVVLPNSEHAAREYVIHPGAVMIIPMLDDGRVVLERQFRYPTGQTMIEFPAGKLDHGEGSLSCARRELREETGLEAQEWSYAGVLHPVISYSTEHIDIWFARGLTGGERHLDVGEFLDVFAATPTELMGWSYDGKVTDAKTLVATLWLHNVLNGTWRLNWFSGDAPEGQHPSPSGPYQPTLTARP